jgi:hypothetical protein
LAADGADSYDVTQQVGGRPDNPGRILERALSCQATKQNWNTIERIVQLESS